MKKKLKSSRNRHAKFEFWMAEYLRDGNVNIDNYEGWNKQQRAGWGSMDWEQGRVWAVADATPMPIKAAWDFCKKDLLADWIADRPGSRPWAWWRFDSPEKRPESESEYDYLKRLNLLTKEENTLKKDD